MKNNINFKKWAFHFIIWVVIINLIVSYLTATYVNSEMFGIEDNTRAVMLALGIVATVLLALSLFFILASIIRKEQKNYQFWIALIGVILFGFYYFAFVIAVSLSS